jgi:Domain of unknown function (DUF4160)
VLDFGSGKITVHIYPKDHTPAHVHIKAPNAEAKFNIETSTWIENDGFSKKALGKLKKFLEERREYLKEQWDEYQG